MYKKILIIIVATITFILLAACAGETDLRNMAPDASRKPYVYNTSKISGEEAMKNETPKPTSTPLLMDYTVIHSEENPIGTPGVESTIAPDGTSVAWDTGPVMDYIYDAYNSLHDLTEELALAYTAVYGRVVKTYDLRIKNYYIDADGERVDASSSNYAAVEFEVYENYTDKELEYMSGKTIMVTYSGSMPSEPNYLKYQFKKDDECIIFISRRIDLHAEQTDALAQEYYEQFPYYIYSFDDSWVMDRHGDKFNAYGLMKLNNGETYSVNKETGRPIELYTKAEIDAVIKANLDKMRGLSLEKFLEERYVRFGI